MTNLYLSYPSIPFDAKVRAQSVTFSEDRPIGNTIYGERYQYSSCTAGASGAIDIEWDLGVGYSTAVDHVIVPNAYKLIQQGTDTIELDAADDGIGGAYSNVWSDSSFDSATLRGADSLDYITTGLSLSAARTWKIKLSGGSATTREINKIYFGTAWNPSKDPNFSYQVVMPEGGSVTTEEGGYYCVRLGDGRYQIQLSWTGVSDAQTQIFYERIVKYWQLHKFFLFTTAEHRILNNLKLMHVRCLSEPQISRRTVYRAGNWEGYNSIDAEFQECKG
jgi:hypothetical protein